MKRLSLFILALATLGSSSAVYADEDASSRAGFFANPKVVFAPLSADPREAQFALQLVSPVGKQVQGEVAMGDYFGLYRWTLPWEKSSVQWSIAGAAFPRFDLATEQKDFEVVDYLAQMPIDVRVGNWSTRIMPYHISSHLGDDFIHRTGAPITKYTFDSYKQLVAYDVSGWRVYGGYIYVIRNEFTAWGHWAAQSGLEWHSHWWANNHAQTYWANDFQSWERTGWNPQFNTQFGIKIAESPSDRQALSLYGGFYAGHLPYGQLFREEETEYIIGLRFEI